MQSLIEDNKGTCARHISRAPSCLRIEAELHRRPTCRQFLHISPAREWDWALALSPGLGARPLEKFLYRVGGMVLSVDKFQCFAKHGYNWPIALG
jgi:hypothetical protein